MSLKDLIVQKKPRETSGPRSANRFDFQKSWALCRLLELHQSGQDYLIVFDYHDDVLVLDSATDPNRIDFYQIKTKQNGHWTRSALVARDNGVNFGGQVIELKEKFSVLVPNQYDSVSAEMLPFIEASNAE
jgi:hypothetical protein